jgi:hypothetical protein
MNQVICEVIDDIEMNDITEKEECVICFEIVDEESKDFKFDCDHKKYMHNSCIKRINKCPLCRIKSESNEVLIVRNNYSIPCGFLSCFILFVFLITLLISPQLYPYYFFGNSNSTNSTNSTNYNSTMIVI